jgi:hypothetical protein
MMGYYKLNKRTYFLGNYLTHMKDDLNSEYKKYEQYKEKDQPLPQKPGTGSLSKSTGHSTSLHTSSGLCMKVNMIL